MCLELGTKFQLVVYFKIQGVTSDDTSGNDVGGDPHIGWKGINIQGYKFDHLYYHPPSQCLICQGDCGISHLIFKGPNVTL